MVKVMFKNDFKKAYWGSVEWYKHFEVDNDNHSYIEKENTVVEIINPNQIKISYKLNENKNAKGEDYIYKYWEAIFEIKDNVLIVNDVLKYYDYEKEDIANLDSSTIENIKAKIQQDMIYTIE